VARQKAGKNPSKRHPYPLREIARQAGVSEATVDRVLNGRGGVRPSTAQTVAQAIDDLDRQRTQLRLTGRTFLGDLVMQAPARFTTAVRRALEAEIPTLRPAVFRARFHLRETATAAEIAALLDGVRRRGSHGVLLRGPDVPEVAEAAHRLVAAGIPVVTLVTDLPSSGRLAYVGIDNRTAGATAAYLVGQWLGDVPGAVLVTLTRSAFRGEEEREMGFRAMLRDRALVVVPDTEGLDAPMRERVGAALDAHPDIRAVYSIGGGNRAVLDAFGDRECRVFIAHDLDADNVALLRAGRISAVLHHDLGQDMRRACHVIMQAHRALPGGILSWPSSIQVVTPFNAPQPPPPEHR
jgi:LacI family transcriptional regulator